MKDFSEEARKLDSNDILKAFKEKFTNDSKLIYLDGNSLGKLPKNTVKNLEKLIKDEWGNNLIRSWNDHWLDLPNRIATKLAKLLGAREDEIFLGDNTSLNLFKLAYAALQFQKGRTGIISDDLNFPTDLYVLQGLIANHFPEHRLQLIKSRNEISVDSKEIHKQLDEQTALVTLSHVCYKSAYMYDMKEVNQLTKKAGAINLWDLSHAVGSVELKLNAWDTDMAVGCTYKYLNGGPGSPAFLYIRKELQEELINPVWSWFGHEKPFDFASDYKAAKGIQKFGTGTPSVLSTAGVENGVDIILETGMENIRRKSISQSEFLIKMIQSELLDLGFEFASPLESHKRGSHVSIRHKEAYKINRAMIEPTDPDQKVIIPDFRPPDIIRLGITPLYTSYADLYECIVRIKEIITADEQNRHFEPLEVT